MKRLLMLVAMFALLACPKKGSASPPSGPVLPKLLLHASTTLTAPDTLVGTFACSGTAPTTQCGVTASAMGGAMAWDTEAKQTVTVGASGTLKIVCGAPNTDVTVTLSLFGTAPGYTNSAPTASVQATGHCPIRAANVPTVPVLTPLVVRSGG